MAAAGLRAVALCFVACGALAAPARAQEGDGLSAEERIRITRGAQPLIRLLVEPFARGPGAADGDARDLEGVTLKDLEFSGAFSVFRLPGPLSGDSASVGAGYRALVRGTARMEGGEIVLKGDLLSLPDRAVIFSREYRTRPEWYREAAHRFADDIVLYLTGRSGIARTRIAFIRVDGRTREVCVVDYDGHGLRAATANGSINMSPAWDPAGDRLAFTSYLKGDADVHLLTLASGAAKAIVTGPGVQSAPAWAPSGQLLAFSQTAGAESGILLCDPSGGGKRRVTRAVGIDTSPSWSPDGRRLVFTSDRSGTPQIYMVNVDGSDARRLTFEGKWNDQPDWSPAGTRVAYASRQGSVFRIFDLDASGLGEARQLTFGPGSDENPRWAPDGRHLVFSSTRSGRRGLYVLNTDSGVVRSLVVDQGDCFSPDWSFVPPR